MQIDLRKPILTTKEVCELLDCSQMTVSRMRKRIQENNGIVLGTSAIPTYLVLLDIGYTPAKVKELTGV